MSEGSRPAEIEDPWDAVVEGSFPASDPPPGPGIIGGPPDRPPETADDDDQPKRATGT